MKKKKNSLSSFLELCVIDHDNISYIYIYIYIYICLYCFIHAISSLICESQTHSQGEEGKKKRRRTYSTLKCSISITPIKKKKKKKLNKEKKKIIGLLGESHSLSQPAAQAAFFSNRHSRQRRNSACRLACAPRPRMSL